MAAPASGRSVYFAMQQSAIRARRFSLRGSCRARSNCRDRKADGSIRDSVRTSIPPKSSFGGAQPRPPQGKVFVNPTRGVLLIASNLPRTPADKIYEMWIIPKGAKPVPAGLFQSQQDGNAMHVRPGIGGTGFYGGRRRHRENQAGADQPTTTPLILAP